MKKGIDKYNWELGIKEQNIHDNLCVQIEKVFRHCNQGSYKTRERYEDGVKNFAKYMADAFRKQNLNNIKPKHLYAYVEFMQDMGYSTSYVTTNLSAIRFFYDQVGGDSNKLPNNNRLGVISRSKEERIGDNKAWVPLEIENFIRYASDVGQERYGDMVRLSSQLGLRIHEVCRLNKSHLRQALQECKITIKGKGGLVRDVPVRDKTLIQKLYNNTQRGEKVFIKQGEQTHRVIKNIQMFIYNNQDKFALDKDKQLTFHGLRHFYCQNRHKELMQHGLTDLQARKIVSRELGHYRIDITEIYLN
ncbi:MAG: site-specific integrase [Clostridium septicum]|uniref:tyrosine-type recombinase/integrase n=1 Tax=Clostridium septicum TaxID=1504 RepID=UPI00258E639B|nr:site-specific integrase [Clostridium septicum]MDU1315251.1 site-specific integrase [Clostridium septicum]